MSTPRALVFRRLPAVVLQVVLFMGRLFLLIAWSWWATGGSHQRHSVQLSIVQAPFGAGNTRCEHAPSTNVDPVLDPAGLRDCVCCPVDNAAI